MELQRITPKDFDNVWALMQSSFPPHELRSRKAQIELNDRDDFCPDIISNNGQFAGIIFYWLYREQCFIEHLATLPSLRGQGIGAAAVNELTSRHSLTVLEIDPVVDDISRRRKGFYERIGFVENPYKYRHPGYAPEFTKHPLTVMSAPRILTPAEFETFKDFNYNTVCKL